MALRTKRGQALMELAVGIFTVTLLVSLLWSFVVYTVKSLRIQNHLRRKPAVIAAEVDVDELTAKYVTHDAQLHIHEPYSDTYNPADSAIPSERIR